MDVYDFIDIIQKMMFAIVAMVSIIVLPGLVVGLVIAVFQAATQINESTLSFLPKLFVIFITIGLLSPWMINHLVEYTYGLIADIPYFIR